MTENDKDPGDEEPKPESETEPEDTEKNEDAIADETTGGVGSGVPAGIPETQNVLSPQDAEVVDDGVPFETGTSNDEDEDEEGEEDENLFNSGPSSRSRKDAFGKKASSRDTAARPVLREVAGGALTNSKKLRQIASDILDVRAPVILIVVRDETRVPAKDIARLIAGGQAHMAVEWQRRDGLPGQAASTPHEVIKVITEDAAARAPGAGPGVYVDHVDHSNFGEHYVSTLQDQTDLGADTDDPRSALQAVDATLIIAVHLDDEVNAAFFKRYPNAYVLPWGEYWLNGLIGQRGDHISDYEEILTELEDATDWVRLEDRNADYRLYRTLLRMRSEASRPGPKQTMQAIRGAIAEARTWGENLERIEAERRGIYEKIMGARDYEAYCGPLGQLFLMVAVFTTQGASAAVSVTAFFDMCRALLPDGPAEVASLPAEKQATYKQDRKEARKAGLPAEDPPDWAYVFDARNDELLRAVGISARDNASIQLHEDWVGLPLAQMMITDYPAAVTKLARMVAGRALIAKSPSHLAEHLMRLLVTVRATSKTDDMDGVIAHALRLDKDNLPQRDLDGLSIPLSTEHLKELTYIVQMLTARGLSPDIGSIHKYASRGLTDVLGDALQRHEAKLLQDILWFCRRAAYWSMDRLREMAAQIDDREDRDRFASRVLRQLLLDEEDWLAPMLLASRISITDRAGARVASKWLVDYFITPRETSLVPETRNQTLTELRFWLDYGLYFNDGAADEDAWPIDNWIVTLLEAEQPERLGRAFAGDTVDRFIHDFLLRSLEPLNTDAPPWLAKRALAAPKLVDGTHPETGEQGQVLDGEDFTGLLLRKHLVLKPERRLAALDGVQGAIGAEDPQDEMVRQITKRMIGAADSLFGGSRRQSRADRDAVKARLADFRLGIFGRLASGLSILSAGAPEEFGTRIYEALRDERMPGRDKWLHLYDVHSAAVIGEWCFRMYGTRPLKKGSNAYAGLQAVLRTIAWEGKAISKRFENSFRYLQAAANHAAERAASAGLKEVADVSAGKASMYGAFAGFMEREYMALPATTTTTKE